MKFAVLKIVTLLICLLLLGAGAQAAEIERYRLDNGLTVVLKQDHEAPVVSIQMWLKAGAERERPGEEGMAHLLEHMFFKGTNTHPTGQFDRIMESLGAQSNAHTAIKNVVYWAEIMSPYTVDVLQLLADALINIKLDPQELAPEARVVVEEMLQYRDMPEQSLWENKQRLNFGANHPYNKNILGSEARVLNFTAEQLRDFYSRLYCGPNMVLVVVGDFSSQQIKPVIAKAFAGLSPQAAAPLKVEPPNVQPGPQLFILHEQVSQATISVSFVVPGLNSDEQYPLRMASDIMGSGLTSRLHWHLKEDQNLVNDVSCNLELFGQYGVMEISATMAPQDVGKVWQPLLSEVYTLLEYPAQSIELERVCKNVKASLVYDGQSMMQQAYQLGEFELLRGGYQNLAGYVDKFRQVNAQAIERGLFKHLNPANMRIIIQAPEGTPVPGQAQVEAWTQKIWSRLNAPRKTQERLVHTLPHGLTLIVESRPAHPLVTMVLATPYGIAAEPQKLAGINQLWASTVCSGNEQYSYEEMAIIQDAKAISLQGYARADSMGIVASSLAQDWPFAMELLAGSWQTPSFTPTDIERGRSMQLVQLLAQADSPQNTALLAAAGLLFPGHPYGRDPKGDLQSLARIQPQDVAALHQRLRGAQGMVMVVVGDVVPQEVLARVEQIFAGEQPLAQDVPNQPVPELREPETSTVHKALNQAQLVLAFRAPEITSNDYYTAQVLQALLNGASGRLFTGIREEQALAYTVYADYAPYSLSGALFIYLGTSVQNKDKALACLQESLQQICRQPANEGQLERAKNYLLGLQTLGRQKYASQAFDLASNFIMGFGPNHSQEWAERIKAVSSEQVMELARALFARQVSLIMVP